VRSIVIMCMISIAISIGGEAKYAKHRVKVNQGRGKEGRHAMSR